MDSMAGTGSDHAASSPRSAGSSSSSGSSSSPGWGSTSATLVASTQRSRASSYSSPSPLALPRLTKVSLQHIDNTALYFRLRPTLCVACRKLVDGRKARSAPRFPTVRADINADTQLSEDLGNDKLKFEPIPRSLRCPHCASAQWCSIKCSQAGVQSFRLNNDFPRVVLLQGS